MTSKRSIGVRDSRSTQDCGGGDIIPKGPISEFAYLCLFL